jgi:hypothetical protein
MILICLGPRSHVSTPPSTLRGCMKTWVPTTESIPIHAHFPVGYPWQPTVWLVGSKRRHPSFACCCLLPDLSSTSGGSRITAPCPLDSLYVGEGRGIIAFLFPYHRRAFVHTPSLSKTNQLLPPLCPFVPVRSPFSAPPLSSWMTSPAAMGLGCECGRIYRDPAAHQGALKGCITCGGCRSPPERQRFGLLSGRPQGAPSSWPCARGR